MDNMKMFARMLKQHCKGKDVALVTSYDNAQEILKMLISLSDTYIEDVTLTRPEWDNYEGCWLINYGANNDIWCSKALGDDGIPLRGDDFYYIDQEAIDDLSPDDFVFGGTEYKVIKGD